MNVTDWLILIVLQMAVQRIQISNNKMTTSVKHQKKEIATLLAEGKEEKARWVSEWLELMVLHACHHSLSSIGIYMLSLT